MVMSCGAGTQDEVLALLDDQLVKVQAIRGSPFVGPIEASCKAWESRLMDTAVVLEAWMTFQRTWLYVLALILPRGDMHGAPRTRVTVT